MKKGGNDSSLFRYLSSDEQKPIEKWLLCAFIDKMELIEIVSVLDQIQTFSTAIVYKLYLLLFELCITFPTHPQLIKILSYYNFVECFQEIFQKKPLSLQKILLTPIAKYLDNFKEKPCVFKNIKALVDKYHVYRMLDCFKEFNSLHERGCNLIQSYIQTQFQNLRQKIFQTKWQSLNQYEFNHFYEQYTKICQLQKRFVHINTKHINFKWLIMDQQQLRNKIEEKNKQIKNAHHQQEQLPKVKVRKNLQILGSMINRMGKEQ